MYCSECGSELIPNRAFSEEGQEDYDWCSKCVDYCDAVETKLTMPKCPNCSTIMTELYTPPFSIVKIAECRKCCKR